MALRTIRDIDEDDILRKRSKEVKEMTPRLNELIDDMFETMRDAEGVGLAAVQVGILKRVVVVETDEEHSVCLINPIITSSDGEQEGFEGCLSIPGKTGVVKRPNHIVVDAYDRNLRPVHFEAEEFFARAICHELDHLDGIVYTDKVEDGKLYTDEEIEKMQAEAEENAKSGNNGDTDS